MNYYDLRDRLARAVPRMTQLFSKRQFVNAVREKGRKKQYSQFSLVSQDFVPQERLLDEQEINSFAEVSLRAQACPLPFNMDVWDALVCPFKCKYCFANAFRASLYTSFFDNARTMGMRRMSEDNLTKQLDPMMKLVGKNPHDVRGDVQKAFAKEMPIRLGIRFENFVKQEGQDGGGITLALLKYLADHNYPVMINTKGDLVGEEPWLSEMERNEGKVAVHMTLISANEGLIKAIEPGAPSHQARIEACKKLVEAGVRVVARLEPFLPFICDDPEDVQKYISDLKYAGVEHITFDSLSYSANNPGIRQSFLNIGFDFERLFLTGCDSQGLGSLLLDKFMDIFRRAGFSCSTFDMGSVPLNDSAICCEVGDWWDPRSTNPGCSTMAVRFVRDAGRPVTWTEFKDFVDERGGFLSDALEAEVHRIWNGEGNEAYSPMWGQGMVPVGLESDGVVWEYRRDDDFRLDLLDALDLGPEWVENDDPLPQPSRDIPNPKPGICACTGQPATISCCRRGRHPESTTK